MTSDETRARIEAIRTAAGDYEVAHSREDDLLWDFVEHVLKVGSVDRETDYIAMLLDNWRLESAGEPRYCA